MILWIVDVEIPKFFATLQRKTLFLHSWTICLHSCSQISEPCHIFPGDLLSLSGCIYSQSWHYHLVPVNLWNVPGGFLFWTFFDFPGLSLPLSQPFWRVLQTSKSISLNNEYIVFVLFSIQYAEKQKDCWLWFTFITVSSFCSHRWWALVPISPAACNFFFIQPHMPWCHSVLVKLDNNTNSSWRDFAFKTTVDVTLQQWRSGHLGSVG